MKVFAKTTMGQGIFRAAIVLQNKIKGYEINGNPSILWCARQDSNLRPTAS
jgi:hypothetical protein